jgi:hypothetical protein
MPPPTAKATIAAAIVPRPQSFTATHCRQSADRSLLLAKAMAEPAIQRHLVARLHSTLVTKFTRLQLTALVIVVMLSGSCGGTPSTHSAAKDTEDDRNTVPADATADGGTLPVAGNARFSAGTAEEALRALDGSLHFGCERFEDFFGGRAPVHPEDEGQKAADLGISEETFTLINMTLERVDCETHDSHSIGVVRYEEQPLDFASYVRFQEVSINESCSLFPDTEREVSAVWSSESSHWIATAGQLDSGTIRGMSLEDRRKLAESIAKVVSGEVIETTCAE